MRGVVILTFLSSVLFLLGGADAWWGLAPPKKTALEIYGPWVIRVGVALAFISGILVALYLVMQAKCKQREVAPNPEAK